MYVCSMAASESGEMVVRMHDVMATCARFGVMVCLRCFLMHCQYVSYGA